MSEADSGARLIIDTFMAADVDNFLYVYVVFACQYGVDRVLAGNVFNLSARKIKLSREHIGIVF